MRRVMDWEGLFGALGKAASKRGGRRGWIEILVDALVSWLRPKVRGAAGERVLELRLRAELAGAGR